MLPFLSALSSRLYLYQDGVLFGSDDASTAGANCEASVEPKATRAARGCAIDGSDPKRAALSHRGLWVTSDGET